MQKLRWFEGVRGHPRSSETSPFESAYDFLFDFIETVRVSCTVFDL